MAHSLVPDSARHGCEAVPFEEFIWHILVCTYVDDYAGVLLHNSFMARVSSWAIIGAVAVSIAERCIR
jgi:hypothetical protein